VQFTIDGSLGTCQLRFGVQISQDDKVEDNPGGGSCTAVGPECYPPLSGALLAGADGIVMVPFEQMSSGSPTKTVDATAITGINWQLVAPLTGDPCMASFTVTTCRSFDEPRVGARAAGRPAGSRRLRDRRSEGEGERYLRDAAGRRSHLRFLAARRGICPAGDLLADLVGKPTVSSRGGRDGTDLPVRLARPSFAALDVVSTMPPGDAASGQALRAEVDSGPAQTDASIAHEGFALYLIDCIDASAYSGVTFTTVGDLGNCPLRFAVQFKGADGGTSVASGVPVAAGTTVLLVPPAAEELAGGGRSISRMIRAVAAPPTSLSTTSSWFRSLGGAPRRQDVTSSTRRGTSPGRPSCARSPRPLSSGWVLIMDARRSARRSAPCPPRRPRSQRTVR
jgi:hypothetical protein